MKEKSEIFSSVSNQERNKIAHALSQQIRLQWADLWEQRIQDKRIAEDMAGKDYELLFVERGTIIKATKDYKPPNLEEIMESNEKLLGLKLTSPNPKVGGWKKFSKEVLSKQHRWSNTSRRMRELPVKNPRNGPPKNGGRGWLHRN